MTSRCRDRISDVDRKAHARLCGRNRLALPARIAIAGVVALAVSVYGADAASILPPVDRAAIAAAPSAPVSGGKTAAQPARPASDETAGRAWAPFAQVYLVLDTSASMMIGSTTADEAKIAAWVSNNKSQVFVGEEDSPCTFACHDRADTALSVSDLQQGETVAHLPSVGATTRFDMMKLGFVNDPGHQDFCGGTDQIACDAGKPPGLFARLRDKYTAESKEVSLSNFCYNMFGFNEGIGGDEPAASALIQDIPDNSQNAVDRSSLLAMASGISSLTIGLDTHLNPPVTGLNTKGQPHQAVMPALASLVGGTRPAAGSTADNPLKFVVIVTDGLSSDRNWNYGGVGPGEGADTLPKGMPHPASVPHKDYCASWEGPPPVVHGAPAWQGTDSKTGTKGLCSNDGYAPGFLPAPPSPGYPFRGANWVFYARPLDPSFCAMMKANAGQPGPGVTIAVLETPYVPLNGQDPADGYPYESHIQQILYPDGNPATHPGSVSAVSAALKSCASSPELYLQAAEDSAIGTDLAVLFDRFVGSLGRSGSAIGATNPLPLGRGGAISGCKQTEPIATLRLAETR